MKNSMIVFGVTVMILAGTVRGYSQHWSLGGDMGLSFLGGSAGFHFTPAAEMLVNNSMGVGSEFSINSQYGTPMIWHPYFKYYFSIRGTQLRPFANAGPLLALNVPNGPCFGFLFGGGMSIPVANRLFLVPNVIYGPIFGYGGGEFPFLMYGAYPGGVEAYGLTRIRYPSVTIYALSLRGGIRYEI